MSKLDFSRQAIPLVEHTEVHDIISGFRTSANLPNLSDDLLGNNHDHDHSYSPALIGFDEAGAIQVCDGLLGRSHLSTNNQSIAKEKTFLFDTNANATVPGHATAATHNPLRRGYRRAQDVSLAAVPSQWRSQSSPVSPCHDESEDQHVVPLVEPKTADRQRQLSCPVTKQLTTLKTLDRRLLHQDKYEVNNGNYKQNFTPNLWNESRRRYFSFDLHSDPYEIVPRPLSATTSLPSTSSVMTDQGPELRKREEPLKEAYEQYTKIVETQGPYEHSYINSEANCNYIVGNNCLPALHEPSHGFSRISSVITSKQTIREAHKPRNVVPSNPSPASYVSSIPESNLNDVKVEYEPLLNDRTENLRRSNQEEVIA